MNTIKDKKKVFVIGSNHLNTLGLIRSLGEGGYSVIVLLEQCDLRFCYLRFSKYIQKMYLLSSLEESLQILKKENLKSDSKSIILSGSDSSICFLDSHYEELREKFHIFNVNGEQGGINYLVDKWNTFSIAEKNGFTLIKTWHVKDIHNLLGDIIYPCLIKANSSVAGSKDLMFVCQNHSELIKNLREGVEYLIQEYIEKDFELDIVGLAYNQGTHVLIPATVRKIRDYFHSQSNYICLERMDKYPIEIQHSIRRFIGFIKYEGLFSIELMCKGDKFYFLEANLRNDGTSYLYTAAGVNYPVLWVKLCDEGVSEDVVTSLKVKTPYYLQQMVDFGNVLHRRVSFFTWLKQTVTADAHFVFNIRDIKPFLYQCYIPIRQLLKKPLNLFR